MTASIWLSNANRPMARARHPEQGPRRRNRRVLTPALAGLSAASIVATALTPHAAGARAQTPYAPPASILIRTHDNPSDQAIAYITQVGAVDFATVHQGEPLEPLILRQCGHIRQAYLLAFRRLNADLVSSETTAKRDGAIALPACAFFEQNVPFNAVVDFPVARLLTRATGLSGPKTTQRFLDLNPAIASSGDPTIVPAESTVTLPYRSRPTNLVLGADYRDRTEEVRLRLRALIPDDETVVPIAETTEGELVPELQTTRASCGAVAPPWPFDPVSLRRDLERVMADAQGIPAQVRIAVLDSGQFEPPAGVFGLDLFAAKDGPPTKTQYGVDAANRGRPPWNTSEMRSASHGSMVATLALGGPGFLQADTPRLSRVAVRPSRILQQGSGKILEEAVLYALEDASQQRATIINASWRFPTSTDFLRKALIENPEMLLVAAAGNEPDLVADVPRWPASFGGRRDGGGGQVITVGASGPDGGIAPFSARGQSYVDILAPGCDVPVFGLDLAPITDGGTSMSAPQVSFTAALLRQVGIQSPARLRERLIVSADVSPGLQQDAFAAGVLNPARAIDVFWDRVDFRDVTRAPLRGRVYLDTNRGFLCKETGTRLSGRDTVLKIARLSADDWLLFWRDANGALDRCTTTLAVATVEFDLPDGQSHPVPAADIQEILISSLPRPQHSN